MRSLFLVACISLATPDFASAQVSITQSPAGWEITNGNIHVDLVRSSDSVELKSLRREGGAEWAVAGTPIVAVPDTSGNHYSFSEGIVSALPKNGKQLTLRFKADSGGLLSLTLGVYPSSDVIELTTHPTSTGMVGGAGTVLLKDNPSGPPPLFELPPGKAVETPTTFIALAKGDTDDAGNEAFRYLKRYVFLTPVPGAPLVTYCWER